MAEAAEAAVKEREKMHMDTNDMESETKLCW